MKTVQATAVCKNNQAVLLMGTSGCGKSLQALTLIEQGWSLISDDMVVLTLEDGKILASPPEKMRGCVEARGLGILSGIPYFENVPVVAVVVFEANQTERMPQKQKFVEISGCYVPLFHLWKEERYLSVLLSNVVKIATGKLNLLQNETESA